jgi:hypothetical protein
MIDSDRLRRQLDEAADAVDVGDLGAANSAVHATLHRRRVRRGVAAALLLGALVAGAALVIGLRADPEVSDLMSPTPITDEAVTVEVVEQPIVIGTSTVPEITAAWPSVVPWQDGFVAWGLASEPRPLVQEFPEDVAALFSPEVRELFEGPDRPATVEEAIALLRAEGLYEEVEAVVSENRAAYDVIFGGTVAVDVEAWTTTDGSGWERVAMELPAPDLVRARTAVGDSVVVGWGSVATGDSSGEFHIARSSDLETWSTRTVDVSRSVDLPEGVAWRTEVVDLVANESGWVARVVGTADIDPTALLRGAGLSPADGGVVDLVATNAERILVRVDGEDGGIVRYGWDELGFSTVDAALVLAGTDDLWAAEWDGDAERVDTAERPYSATAPLQSWIATPSGFLAWSDRTWFSADGLEWTGGPLPEPLGTVVGALHHDDAVTVFSAMRDNSIVVHRLGEAGGVPRPVELEIDATTLAHGYSWVPPTAVGPSALVLDGPTPLLVASADGERFVVTDLDEPIAVATNESVALVGDGGGWTAYQLP